MLNDNRVPETVRKHIVLGSVADSALRDARIHGISARDLVLILREIANELEAR